MSQFVYRFQPVLSVKKQMENSKKNELGKAVRKFEDEKEELKRIELNRDECIEDMKQYATNNIDVIYMKECNKFLRHIKECINVQRDNVAVAEENVEGVRKELVNAVKERKTFDKLKEKYLYQYNRQQLLNEQKLNDELSGYKYSMRGIE